MDSPEGFDHVINLGNVDRRDVADTLIVGGDRRPCVLRELEDVQEKTVRACGQDTRGEWSAIHWRHVAVCGQS